MEDQNENRGAKPDKDFETELVQWRRVEFEQLNAAGRTIYDSYFKLASMTFAWNASLATIFGVLTGSNVFSGLPYLFISFSIFAIAIIYNWGAFSAHRFCLKSFGWILTEFKKDVAYKHLHTTEILSLMLSSKNTGNVPLSRKTDCFFVCLFVLWFLFWLFSITVYWNGGGP